MRLLKPYLLAPLMLCGLFILTTSFTRTWYQKANHGGDARHRVVGFAIGNKGYIGGGHVNSGIEITYRDFWEYDPATNSWTQIADFAGGLRYHSSAFVIDGAAYVGCGENSTNEYTNDFWKYVPEVNSWFAVADMPGTPRRGGIAFSVYGLGYYGTGQSEEGYHTDLFEYDPASDTWTSIADFPGEARNASVSFVYESKAYVGTGHKVGEALNDFFVYDPATDSWDTLASVGGSIRQDAMGFCIDGKGYIGLGNDNIDTDFRDIWEYDFDLDTWTKVGDFAGQKRRYAVTFVIENNVYLCSGTDGTNMKDLWVWAPTVSIEEEQLHQLSINAYPNPSNDWMRINLDGIDDLSTVDLVLSISNINGQTVYKKPIDQSQIILNKNEIGSGIYFAQITSSKGIVHQTKIAFK